MTALIPQFTEGKLYKRTEIHDNFGGSRQSGISPSKKSPAIFIFSGKGGEQYGYKNHWSNDYKYYYYTGQGQVGDMDFTLGNKAIRDQMVDGRALYVFEEEPGPGGFYKYLGEMQYEGYEDKRGLDKEGNERRIIVFTLALIEVSTSPTEESAEVEELIVQNADDAGLSELRERAYAAVFPSQPDNRMVTIARHVRSQIVVAYALLRANGVCECCQTKAPFRRKNSRLPYLEVHHIDRLSDGGLDAPDRVAAICPNCHRNIHFGEDGAEINNQLRSRIKQLEDR